MYVRRNTEGKIDLIASLPYEDQNGATSETLPDDDAEIIAYLNPPKVSVLYPVDLWSRLSNQEADAVEAAIASQPVRLQNIFRSASSYRSDHELWPLLKQITESLFGAARAAEILLPSASN